MKPKQVQLYKGLEFSRYGRVSTPLSVLEDRLGLRGTVTVEPLNIESDPADGSRDQSLTTTSSSKLNVEIEALGKQLNQIFLELQRKFGFQADSVANQQEHLESIIISKLRLQKKRLSIKTAVDALFAQLISGKEANYRQWYLQTAVGLWVEDDFPEINVDGDPNETLEEKIQDAWERRMKQLSEQEKLKYMALYFLLWGEAANLRFAPEFLCFLLKLAIDYDTTVDHEATPISYLTDVITPAFNFLRGQLYKESDGQSIRRSNDHSVAIGYDDFNETFWTSADIHKIVTHEKKSLIADYPKNERFIYLKSIKWKASCRKTFLERRTPLHILVNFLRIWVLHISLFWYFFAWNMAQLIWSEDTVRNNARRISFAATGGVVASLLVVIGLCVERLFLPFRKQLKRFLFNLAIMMFLFLLNLGPSVYIFLFARKNDRASLAVAISQLVVSIVTFILCIIKPKICFSSRRSIISNFAPLEKKAKITSIGLWLGVFATKFIASYFYLVSPFSLPLFRIYTYSLNCGNSWWICEALRYVTLMIMFSLNLVLFLLDSYIWYIVWSTIYGICCAWSNGISAFTPWKALFSRVPDHLKSRIFSDSLEHSISVLPIAQLWNSIILSMFREHLIPMTVLEKLLYRQVFEDLEEDEGPPRTQIIPPDLFSSDTNELFKTFGVKEAARRLNYLTQSLSVDSPRPGSMKQMASLTVLIPHYSEKIILNMRELIREHEGNYQKGISVLDYLKALYPDEWRNFLEDSKFYSGFDLKTSPEIVLDGQMKDLNISFQAIGIQKTDANEILRTRLWASLRSQTLFRTISGFTNYNLALDSVRDLEKMNRDSENREEKQNNRKVRLLVAMQRYADLSPEVLENVEFILDTYPDVHISYVEKITDTEDETKITYYNCLINGYCEKAAKNRRCPMFRIQLPGPPILGDGKSDNQNLGIVFARGEFIQLIDANQDCYFEESLKLRNLLNEFREDEKAGSSVAIVGAREHIFTAGVGALGDLAAAKEYTFGTISQRVSASLGGRLHYGHPDILNTVFMITRGGVSKGQKGLHLNEDIYAGMNAMMRGGIIKHTEYVQFGKGRDLGFRSILGFASKIGSGMGEQMLSREQYYLGTNLPLDRLLTFYYAHPGFHLNNAFSMLAIRIFVACLMFVAAMAFGRPLCNSYPVDSAKTIIPQPSGCFDLFSISSWVQQTILSIVLVMFLSYLPFLAQLMLEFGVTTSLKRIGKHIVSLTSFFEIFSTQVYSYTLSTIGLSIGGAAYVATGRGFATYRLAFHTLYSSFAQSCLYQGSRLMFLLLIPSVMLSNFGIFVFFWLVAFALIISPFLFNPHQFQRETFLLDYRKWIMWLFEGSDLSDSWIVWYQKNRAQITGSVTATGHSAASKIVLFFHEVLLSAFAPILYTILYAYSETYPIKRKQMSPLVFTITALVLGLAPLILNFLLMLIIFVVNLIIGTLFGLSDTVSKIWGRFLCVLMRSIAIIIIPVSMILIAASVSWNLPKYLMLQIASWSWLRLSMRVTEIFLLGKEFSPRECDVAFWSGRWYGRNLGYRASFLPIRELICKVIEQLAFATDYLIGHLILIILFPFTWIPKIDKLTTLMLLWTKDSQYLELLRDPISSVNDRRRRTLQCWGFGLLLTLHFILFLCFFILPDFVQLPSIPVPRMIASFL